MIDNSDPNKITCSLYVSVAEQGFLETAYCLSSGTERGLRITGTIDGLGQHSAFDKKSAHIEIRSPFDAKRVEGFQTTTNEPKAIGCVDVTENVEPKKYDDDEGGYEDEPIHALIYMNPDAFEAIFVHLANPHGRILGVKLELSGSALPNTGISFVFLSDLDTTKRQTYAVTSIVISDTKYSKKDD